MSPTRGLVEYNALTDTFETVGRNDARIRDREIFSEMEIHTVFGDTFWLLRFLEKCGLIAVLRAVFPKDDAYERALYHILHGVLKNGSRISCDNFLRKSFASYVLKDVPVASLYSDTRFFTLMGEDSLKASYFRTFVASMQKQDSSFGKGCYVDSTPLPKDIDNNLFNAPCRHGVSSSEVMTRLISLFSMKRPVCLPGMISFPETSSTSIL